MQIIVTSSVDRYVATMLVRSWNRFRTIGLPTGQTPTGIYGWLIQHFYDRRISFASKTTFNLDEYLGLAPNDPASFRTTMQRILMQYIDLPKSNFHVPPGLATDVDQACDAYEQAIESAGGLDLCLLGIGVNGHIGFNEPGSASTSRTRCVQLSESSRMTNASAFGGDPERVPRAAITMGISTILDANEIILVAKGKEKADAIARAVREPQSPDLPASFLQGHERCALVLDPDSAERLLCGTTEDAPVIRGAAGLPHPLVIDR